MTTIEPFDFRGHQVRVVLADDGEPRWVASDVATVLGLGRTHDMVRTLDDDERGADSIRTPSGAQTMTTITESGLYSVILRSRKSEAKDFRRWVTHEVLPTIRRTGSYNAPSSALSGPELMAAALVEANQTLQQAQARVQELEAPAHSWQQLADATGDWSVSDAAKILSRDDSITIGRDRLFAFMAGLGWVFRTKGRRAHWEAYQRAVDAGRLTHKIGGTFFNERTEETEAAAPTVRITPKGLQDLHRALGGTHQMALFTQPHELSA